VRRIAILPLFLLAGCAGVFTSSVPTMAVFTPEVYDKYAYTVDLDTCRQYALDPSAQRGFSYKAIGKSGIQGGASNLSGAAVSLLVPALGALGGVTTEALEEFGLTDTRQRAIFVKCLDKKTEMDHSALVLEPNPTVQ
jgi:hypothetical protein